MFMVRQLQLSNEEVGPGQKALYFSSTSFGNQTSEVGTCFIKIAYSFRILTYCVKGK